MTDSPDSATVTLVRNHDTDVRERQVYARLDDAPNHMLLFGDAVTLSVPAGSHRLRANNTLFFKSLEFSAAPGEHVTFVLINRHIWRRLQGLGFFVGGMPLRLVIERR